MKTLAHHLSLLGLDSCDSLETLKSAYRREMLKYHPDLFHQNPKLHAVASERAKQINEANDQIKRSIESGTHNSIDGARNAPKPGERPGDKNGTEHRKQCPHGFPNSSVEEIYLDSTLILSAGYDPEKCMLYIKFRYGAVLGYFDVPDLIYHILLQSSSPGQFAHENIFRNFRSVRYCVSVKPAPLWNDSS